MSNLPVATRVKDEIMKVQIPNNCRPGDSFVVTPPDGQVFTVIVPDNAMPGSFIDIVVPSDDAGAPNPNPSSVTLKKSTIGAVLAGGAVGLLFGPIGVVCLAGGALAAVSDKGAIGASSRSVGDKIYNKSAEASNWAKAQISNLSTSAKNEYQKVANKNNSNTGNVTNQYNDPSNDSLLYTNNNRHRNGENI